MAERVGFRALYVSGAGVANASHGWPDLALTTLNDVLEDVRRITGITDLPVLVEIDTGWGNALMIKRVIRELMRAGAAGVHIEDQVQAKRCGHLPGKALVSRTAKKGNFVSFRCAADWSLLLVFAVVGLSSGV